MEAPNGKRLVNHDSLNLVNGILRLDGQAIQCHTLAMDADGLASYLPTRYAELESKLRQLNEHVDKTTKEMQDIRTAAKAIDLELVPVNTVQGRFKLRLNEPSSQSTGRQVPEVTMKQASLEILRECPGGLATVDILQILNDRLKTEYPRSSLSPQLSRLRAEGKIYRQNGMWMLSGRIGAENENGAPSGAPETADT